jgi:hypothetical protein
MDTPPPDPPVYSLSVRKALRLVVMIPLLTILILMVLHHKAIINLEEILGIPENYLYIGFVALAVASIVPAFLIWKCPGCGAYLGRQANPTRCASCGAEFR